MIITISGNSGSGKSTFSKMLSNYINFKLIDVDLIVSKMYDDKTMCNNLHKTFGDVVLDENGVVSKKLVGKLVFSDLKQMNILNDLTWGYIEIQIDKLINKHKNVVIDYKFLPLTKYFNLSKFNILISVIDNDVRINKIAVRDNVSIEYVKSREGFVPNYKEFAFDYVVINDFTENFAKKSEFVIEDIKERILWVLDFMRVVLTHLQMVIYI